MPRFVVERTFPDGLRIPLNADGVRACSTVIETNAKRGVTWVHSYVSEDLRKLYCIYDGPTPEAVREAAHDNNLPLDKITAVNVLDPYFYRG
jgi:predicted amidohydrolase YtcJ